VFPAEAVATLKKIADPQSHAEIKFSRTLHQIGIHRRHTASFAFESIDACGMKLPFKLVAQIAEWVGICIDLRIIMVSLRPGPCA
jgi:hypothetical protein